MSVSLVPSHARWSFQAGSTSLQQFQFVNVNSSGQIVTPTVTGAFAFVLDDAPSNIGATITNDMPSGNYTVGNYYGCVAPSGVFQKVITGASLTPGTAIMTDTSGHAVACLTGGVVLGWTIASSSSGDIATMLLNVAAHY
jgi:hypothetical protein